MSESDDIIPQSVSSESTPSPEREPGFLSAPFQQPPPPQHADVFWGWHDFFMFVLTTVLALGVAMMAAMGLRRLFHISEAHMNIVLVVAQFAAYGLSFTFLRFMFRAQYDEPLMASLHWLPTRIEPTRLLLIGLGQAFTIAMIGAFMRIPQMETPMSRLLADRPTAMVIAFFGVTAAPVAEELAFRGLLQPLLIRTVGVIPGIFVTSLLFGAMHLEQYGAWQSVVLITLAGAGFGVMRHWTGSTKASAFMHAGYNSALFLLFFTQKGPHA